MRYNTFKDRFHAPILAKTKFSTIRPGSRYKPGDPIALRCWIDWPYNSPMGWIGHAIVRRVASIEIYYDCGVRTIIIDGKILDDMAHHAFAQQEGFNGLEDMMAWFRDQKRLPLSAVLIEWNPETFKAGAPE